jgi:hypothetical protein
MKQLAVRSCTGIDTNFPFSSFVDNLHASLSRHVQESAISQTFLAGLHLLERQPRALDREKHR